MRKFRGAAAAGAALALVMSVAASVSTAAAQPATLTCGSVITQSTRLANDVGPCTIDGIIIGADNVKLNLGGHKVFGDPAAALTGNQYVGVHFMNVSGSEVANGEVLGFSDGVRIDGGSANHVTRISSHDNVGGPGDNGDGIAAWNSSFNTIDKNTVVHNGPYSGISLVTGDYTVNPTTRAVTSAITATGNKILDNLIDNNNVQICPPNPAGCHPRDPRTGAVLTGVTIPPGGMTTGLQDDGIRVEGPNETSSDVERNVTTNNGNNGIFVMPSCHDAFLVPGTPTCAGDVGNINTLVKQNEADHNGYGRANGSGINLFGMGYSTAIQASFETVVGNTTEYNVNSGIVLFSTRPGPRGPGGPFSTPGSCNDLPSNDPRLCASHDNIVLNNTSSFNGLNLAGSLNGSDEEGDGIELAAGANRNTVSHNTVNGNGVDGIGVEMAQLYDASNHPVFDSSGNPVYAPGTGASDNTLAANRGIGNNRFDGEDQNPGCDNNHWDHSFFGTVNQPCVRGPDSSGQQPANASSRRSDDPSGGPSGRPGREGA